MAEDRRTLMTKRNGPIQGAWLDECRDLMGRQWGNKDELSYAALQRLASERYFGTYDVLYCAIYSLKTKPAKPYPYLRAMSINRVTLARFEHEASMLPTPKNVDNAINNALTGGKYGNDEK